MFYTVNLHSLNIIEVAIKTVDCCVSLYIVSAIAEALENLLVIFLIQNFFLRACK